MKIALLTFVAPLAMLALPAAAQSVTDTHQMRWAPVGKVPAAHFHPNRDACRTIAAPTHLAGKGQLVTPAATASCTDQLAAKKAAKQVAIAGSR